MILTLTILNSIAFLIYGFLCIFTKHMVEEFKEFGLSQFRTLTGVLEICGAAGSLVGYFWSSHLYIFSTSGLTLLMLLGVYTRVKIKQPLKQSFQALSLLLLNAFLSYKKIMMEFFNL